MFYYCRWKVGGIRVGGTCGKKKQTSGITVLFKKVLKIIVTLCKNQDEDLTNY